MEAVYLMKGHYVDVLFQEVHLKEVEAAVKMHAPVGEAGPVLNAYAGDAPFDAFDRLCLKDLLGEQLEKALDGVEGP